MMIAIVNNEVPKGTCIKYSKEGDVLYNGPIGGCKATDDATVALNQVDFDKLKKFMAREKTNA